MARHADAHAARPAPVRRHVAEPAVVRRGAPRTASPRKGGPEYEQGPQDGRHARSSRANQRRDPSQVEVKAPVPPKVVQGRAGEPRAPRQKPTALLAGRSALRILHRHGHGHGRCGRMSLAFGRRTRSGVRKRCARHGPQTAGRCGGALAADQGAAERPGRIRAQAGALVLRKTERMAPIGAWQARRARGPTCREVRGGALPRRGSLGGGSRMSIPSEEWLACSQLIVARRRTLAGFVGQASAGPQPLGIALVSPRRQLGKRPPGEPGVHTSGLSHSPSDKCVHRITKFMVGNLGSPAKALNCRSVVQKSLTP